MVYQLEREQLLAHPVDRVFEFFAQARNLERITPPWLNFELLTPEPITLGEGSLIEYRLHLHHVPLGWTSRIDEWDPGRSFVDRQLRGPYRLWRHRHTFEAVPAGTLVRDTVDYSLPLGRLGRLAHGLFVRRDLERIFAFRHEAVESALQCGAPVTARV